MRASTVGAILARTIESRLRACFGLKMRPYKLLLELTDECNSRCISCAIWNTPARVKADRMTLSDIEQLFVSSGRDLAWLALSGGEITLYDDLPRVIELARKYCPSLRLVTFTTNGLLPKRALSWAHIVKAAGFDGFITISLDGDSDTHDVIRGVKGNHRLAWETYNSLRASGIAVHFGITVSQWNEGFIRDQYPTLRDKLKAVTFLHGDGIYGQANLLDDESISRSMRTIDSSYKVSGLGDLLEKIYIRLGLVFLRKHRSKNTIPCSVGHTSLHIRPDGTTLLCMYMSPVGNIKSGLSLSEMVNSFESRELLARIARDECPHCWMNCYAPHSVLMSPWRSLCQCWATSVDECQSRSGAATARLIAGPAGREDPRPWRAVSADRSVRCAKRAAAAESVGLKPQYRTPPEGPT